jgi:metallo-beta-lactamase family protein
MSAHADADELIAWLTHRGSEPATVCVVHGEYEVQQAFAARLAEEFGWRPQIPDLGDVIVV